MTSVGHYLHIITSLLRSTLRLSGHNLPKRRSAWEKEETKRLWVRWGRCALSWTPLSQKHSSKLSRKRGKTGLGWELFTGTLYLCEYFLESYICTITALLVFSAVSAAHDSCVGLTALLKTRTGTRLTTKLHVVSLEYTNEARGDLWGSVGGSCLWASFVVWIG